MKIIDTHVLIWLVNDQSQIPDAVLDILEQEATIGVSAISLWEVAMLVQKGRIDLDMAMADWFEIVFDKPKLRLIPLSPAVAVCSGGLAMHGDPADRLIAASSIVHDVPLITADRTLHQLDFVRAIWSFR